jgi:hypothetical protein
MTAASGILFLIEPAMGMDPMIIALLLMGVLWGHLWPGR